jgi:NADH-quinone oxidoreductase subunit M
LGTFSISILFATLASLGLIAATVYSLRIMQKVFFERKKKVTGVKDLSLRESIILGLLVVAIVFTGLMPQPVFDRARPAIIKTIGFKQSGNQAERSSLMIFADPVVETKMEE